MLLAFGQYIQRAQLTPAFIQRATLSSSQLHWLISSLVQQNQLVPFTQLMSGTTKTLLAPLPYDPETQCGACVNTQIPQLDGTLGGETLEILHPQYDVLIGIFEESPQATIYSYCSLIGSPNLVGKRVGTLLRTARTLVQRDPSETCRKPPRSRKPINEKPPRHEQAPSHSATAL